VIGLVSYVRVSKKAASGSTKGTTWVAAPNGPLKT
jgi:hypothetical protein